jgi:hypothetical protein
VIFGVLLPANTELEFDDAGRVTGAVLGAALSGVRGPAGLTWGKGAWVECVKDRWVLEG